MISEQALTTMIGMLNAERKRLNAEKKRVVKRIEAYKSLRSQMRKARNGKS